MLSAGIDIGSTTAKCVLLKDNEILGCKIIPSELVPEKSAEIVMASCLEDVGIKKEEIEKIVSTGYGRHLAKVGDEVITEIKACSIGVNFLDKDVIRIQS